MRVRHSYSGSATRPPVSSSSSSDSDQDGAARSVDPVQAAVERRRRKRTESGNAATPRTTSGPLLERTDAREPSKAADPVGPQKVAPEACEKQEEGVFEIRDFTNASSFERLTHRITLAVKKWTKLLREGEDKERGQVMREEFEHLGFTYDLSFQSLPHQCQASADSSAGTLSAPSQRLGLHTFPTRAHRLQRWFGLFHFAVLSVRETCIDVDSARTVLSALSLGVKNAAAALAEFVTLSPLSCFVPIESARRRRYVGEVITGSVRTVYATDQTSNVVVKLEHLSGLLEYFWQKLGGDASAPGQTLTVGARFTYLADVFDPVCIQSNVGSGRWQEELPLAGSPSGNTAQNSAGLGRDIDDYSDTEDVKPDARTSLADSATEQDAVESLQLHCIWPSFPAGSFADNALFSELDPRGAPYWKLRLICSGDAPLPLAKRLRALLEFRKEARTVRSAEHSVLPQMPKTVMASLNYAIQESLESILLPTAGEMEELAESCMRLPTFVAETPGTAGAGKGRSTHFTREALRPIRGAARGTRLARLAELCAEMRCFKGAVMLWCQVVMEMRHHWDALRLQPVDAPSPATARSPLRGVRAEYFDESVCLAQQKFEMLQRSIEARRGGCSAHTRASQSSARSTGEASGEPLVCPSLLLPALLTEDMAVQRDMAAASISDPTERMELHGREMRSDMSAFKAANPDATMRDFRRWREEVEGLRSEPFSGEFFSSCWRDAVPKPAAQQTLMLFEPEREAEMALHYLENIEGTQLLLQLVRVLLCSLLEELSDMAAKVLAEGFGDDSASAGHSDSDGTCVHLRQLRDKAVAAALLAFGPTACLGGGSDAAADAGSGGGAGHAAVPDAAAALVGEAVEFPEEGPLEAALAAFESFESAVRLVASLRAKFPSQSCKALLEPLLAEGEASITCHAQRKVVEEFFDRSLALSRSQYRGKKAEGAFDSLPFAKEFVLLLQPAKSQESTGSGLGGAKRLYAEIRNRHLRLASARGIRLA